MPTIQSIIEDYDDNVIALTIHLGNPLNPDDKLGEAEAEELIEALDDAKKSIEDGDYLSLTDEEADDIEDSRLESYIDDCILPELPEAYRYYFDSEAWKSDNKTDGRGHIIASYDNEEHEQEYNGTTYYIYRIN